MLEKALEIIRDRMDLNICDINDEFPIDLYKEILDLKKELMALALEEGFGNKTLAAKLLNMNRTTFITALSDLSKDRTGKNKRVSFYKKS
jgi:DNA-binding protein Fis